jgi:hypothetical protein
LESVPPLKSIKKLVRFHVLRSALKKLDRILLLTYNELQKSSNLYEKRNIRDGSIDRRGGKKLDRLVEVFRTTKAEVLREALKMLSNLAEVVEGIKVTTVREGRMKLGLSGY